MKIILYQLLPRLFGNPTETLLRGGTKEQNGCGRLVDITPTALQKIKSLGVTHIWYTGLLEHATQTDYSGFGIRKDHSAIVKGCAGSPYAVKDYYDIDPDLATSPERRMEEFIALTERTHRAGMKVIMDFVPNHVARQYHSDAAPPDVHDLGSDDNPMQAFSASNNFYYIPGQSLHGSFDMQANEAYPYRESPAKATGNDLFTATPSPNDWYETVKLNYGVDYLSGGRKRFTPVPDTWTKMRDILMYWAEKGVDGFRCDMAEMVPCEFWEWCLKPLKQSFPQLVFIGEVYNPSLYRDYLYRGGFDLLYDKVGLYDTLRGVVCGQRPATSLSDCWKSVGDIQEHMLNFLENHDEQRIASDFFAKSGLNGFPALVVSACMNTNPFMLYFGQEFGERGMDQEGYSGLDGRTSIFDYWSPATLRQWYDGGHFTLKKLSPESKRIYAYYKKVLTISSRERAISDGLFFDLMYCNGDNPHFRSDKVYAFIRKQDNEAIFVLANFDTAPHLTGTLIPSHAFDYLKLKEGEFESVDLLTGKPLKLTLRRDATVSCRVPARGAVMLKTKF